MCTLEFLYILQLLLQLLVSKPTIGSHNEPSRAVDGCGRNCQEFNNLECGGVSPLQVIQEKNQWTATVGHSTAQVADCIFEVAGIKTLVCLR